MLTPPYAGATFSRLDPMDWEEARALGYRAIDDAVAFLRDVRERPTWTAPPSQVRATLQAPLPFEPQGAEGVYEEFLRNVLPYSVGNTHPRFFAWVHGTGSFTGALADFLASVMNANLGIGNTSPGFVDRQVINWCKELLRYPSDSGGVMVSGASVANMTALAVAREWALGRAAIGEGQDTAAGADVDRREDAGPEAGRLVAYGSSETHSCVRKSLRLLGVNGYRLISADRDFRMPLDALRAQIRADREAGKQPFCLIGTAGTVNTGAIDPLEEMAQIAAEENLWFHVDGAFGAMACLVPEFREALSGMEKADSIAFDLHKWMYMPYGVACTLVRNATLLKQTFTTPATYLTVHERGLAADDDPPGNRGMELSQPFRSLKVWMCLKEHGVARYASAIRVNIEQAKYLGDLVKARPELELLARVTLNIVCFRYLSRSTDRNAFNRELLIRLQESGKAVPSYVVIDGQYGIRVAHTNHRTAMEDMRVLVDAVLEIGKQMDG